MSDHRDVVIVGGGHNGLAGAAYLALAGKKVTLLERLPHIGGAAVSATAFEGVDARLSRYSYLVSLLPERIIRDLGLSITLARRRYSSYTPTPGGTDGLLIDTVDAAATAAALGADSAAWNSFYSGTSAFARALFPTVIQPLLTRTEARAAVGDAALWSSLVDAPIGSTIADTFSDDVVRGVVLTDALIGTFAPNVDESMAANRCFAYHVIGGGTGDWDVPVGGMGAVTGELARAALNAGAEIITDATVTSITPGGEVTYLHDDTEATLDATWVLANVAPFELQKLLGETQDARPEGAQVKVNLLVSRLPRLRDSRVDPAAAFGGTFHINESWSQLDSAFDAASAGSVPNPLPSEIYCHSLTDPSILSPELQASGAQTLTIFGLHTPDRLLTESTNDAMRQSLQRAAINSLNSVLAEPIEDLLLQDVAGNPTIETKTTLDLQHALNLPGGNIFHGPLAWPFAEDDAELRTPAQRWGVATAHPRILLCGAGAQRGGGVSAIGGHNAAMAVLEAS
ncbi:phytoene dehydrogenase-like protein [Salinibacterium sp. CAN_S4]|uniref:phytoene desaturase family protein n=1 Tax=Salinibacterium sp. CAN_S4 TaxID=2787727 RepID=UPI001A185CBE